MGSVHLSPGSLVPSRWTGKGQAGGRTRLWPGHTALLPAALCRPRLGARGHPGQGPARDAAFSSNQRPVGPLPPTPTHSLLVFIFMFNKQYIHMVQNSKAYTRRSLPRPNPAPRPPEAAGESLSWDYPQYSGPPRPSAYILCCFFTCTHCPALCFSLLT